MVNITYCTYILYTHTYINNYLIVEHVACFSRLLLTAPRGFLDIAITETPTIYERTKKITHT